MRHGSFDSMTDTVKKGPLRAGMKDLPVSNSHPAELLRDADVVVKSLEDVKLSFLQNMCP